VTFIPVLFKVLELVYDIIPKKILKKVVDLLESLQLVAIWHYLLMGLAVLLALALIYLLQKKLFSHERLVERRIARGHCQECGAQLPGEVAACPFCGAGQFRQCSHCDRPTWVHGKYCRECGRTRETS
jgi:RNA polymerase subunit RPABC4/transcription elongation factor Spt4